MRILSSSCLASILFVTSCDALSEDEKTAAVSEPVPDPVPEPIEAKPVQPIPEPKPAPEPKPEPSSEPDPEPEPTFTLALRADVYLTPTRTTDGTILIHAAGKLARVQDGAVVDVPGSGATKAMDGREVFLDHFGGRWPDAVFTCWMGGLPNRPGRPTLMRFDPDAGWKKVSNGGGKDKWCYEGFAATTSGALLSRKVARDYLEEQFARGPFVSTDRRPRFSVIEGAAEVTNPMLPWVADWTVGNDDELWTIAGAELIRLAPGKPPQRFALPESIGRRSAEPLRLSWAAGTLYVHGGSREDGWRRRPYLARWKDGALEPIELPKEILPPDDPSEYSEEIHIADVQVAPNGDLWMLAGRLLWIEVGKGTLWRKTGEGWEHVVPVDEKQVDPKADPQFVAHESIGGFELDGDDLWVSVRAFRYGMGASGVLLTTKPVAKELAWTFFP